MHAHVRAKSTGKEGGVRGREEGPDGTRYHVMHFRPLKDRLRRDGTYPPPDEKVYAANDLEFLYAIRPGAGPRNLR